MCNTVITYICGPLYWTILNGFQDFLTVDDKHFLTWKRSRNDFQQQMDSIIIINAKQISLWHELFVDYVVISEVGPLGANYHMGANRICQHWWLQSNLPSKEGFYYFCIFLVESIVFALDDSTRLLISGSSFILFYFFLVFYA